LIYAAYETLFALDFTRIVNGYGRCPVSTAAESLAAVVGLLAAFHLANI
jgi:hypothetical protein